MLRSFSLVLLASTVVLAQPPKDLPPKDVPPGVKDPAPITVDLRQFPASPAAAPTPSLKYELLPRLRDRVSGNAALDYHRAYSLRPSWPRDPKEAAKLSETLIAWEDAPIEKLPVVEMKKYLAGYSQLFRMLDSAAKADRCDWEMTNKLSVNNIDLLLPEVQTFRELARFQRMRVRVDLAENDFDAAVRHIQTGLRLGKDVGEGSTLIQSLVGIAIASIALRSVEEFIERPNSPNLYWALTTLPRPLIDPRPALEGESQLFDKLFPNAKLLEKGSVSTERANVLLEEMLTAFQTMGNEDMKVGAGGFGLAGYVALNAPGARKQLVEMGWDAATVEKMPPAQVIGLRAIVAYRTMTDDQTKCFSLPYPEAKAELAKVRVRADKLKKDSGDAIVAVFGQTLPAVEKVYEAHARLNRRVTALRVVEAIRLHAATNNGKLPKSLADIKIVPVPEDPYTQKPFEYTVKDNSFTLTGLPPTGEKPSLNNHLRYEISLRVK